jgi:hypothetical protein
MDLVTIEHPKRKSSAEKSRQKGDCSRTQFGKKRSMGFLGDRKTALPFPTHMQPLLEQSRPSSTEPGPKIQRVVFRQPENFPSQSSLAPVYTKATTRERCGCCVIVKTLIHNSP